MENSRIGPGPIQTKDIQTNTPPSFRLGQTVRLTVDSHNPQGTVFRYGGLHLQSQTNLPFTSGHTIVGEVTATAPTLTLKLRQPQNETMLLSKTINVLLPRQTPLPSLLANLSALSHRDDLTDALTPLISGLATTKDIESEHALKAAVSDSGIFLENRLLHAANNSDILSGDFKAGLMRLLAVLLKQQADSSVASNGPAIADLTSAIKNATPPATRGRAITPPYRGMMPEAQPSEIPLLTDLDLPFAIEELTAQTQGSLARIELMQLANLADQHNATPAMNLELPLRHNQRIDLVSLCIDQQSRTTTADPQAKDWTVTLALALPELGPLSARLTFRQSHLSARIWVEHATSAEQIIEHLSMLRDSLVAVGLQVDHLDCEVGQMPQTNSFKTDIPLIDIKA